MNQPEVGQLIVLPFFDNRKFIIGKIISGGMGHIFQLVPTDQNFPTIALKTFKNIANAEAFKSECEIWLKMSAHPCVAEAIWYGTFLGQNALASKWYPHCLEDQNIAQWSLEQITELVCRMAEALEYMHLNYQIVHQDIKGANILLDKELRPFLTDFGIAKSFPNLNVNSFEKLKFSSETMNFGGISGTPFFMAPELLSGQAIPSINTDIFSLGITLFKLFTNQHPYLLNGKMTLTPQLNLLTENLKKHGANSLPLLNTITNMIQLDPQKRSQTYDSIFRSLGVSRLAQVKADSTNEKTSVAIAAMLREEGKFSDASAQLIWDLAETPDSPVLNNSMGILEIKKNNANKGILFFQKAVHLLDQTNGKIKNRVYIDPYANLAWQLIYQNRFLEADDCLKKCWKFLKANDDLQLTTNYTIFGWMFLFEGNFQRSSQFLLDCSTRIELNYVSIQCFALAAALNDESADFAGSYLNILKAKRPLSVELAISACLLATKSSTAVARELISIANKDAGLKIEEIEKAANLMTGALRPPKSSEARDLLIRSLDVITGGRYSGTIRQVS